MLNLQSLTIAIIVCSQVFVACSSVRSDDKRVYIELNDQLEISTKVVQRSSIIYFNHLDSKTYDPHTADKANIWLTKATKVRQLTADMYHYSERSKQSVKNSIDSFSSDSLTGIVAHYVAVISTVDSALTKQFKPEIDKLKSYTQQDAIHYSKLGTEAILCLLSKLQNQVSVLESSLIAYCDNNVGTTYDGFSIAIPLINQNATHLKKEDELKVNVGVAYLNYPSWSKVYINGDSMKVSDNGFFNYKKKVTGQSGKYSIPVKIEYYKNSEKITTNKTVDYYID